MSKESERAKELAEAHWGGYVGPMVANHLTATAYTNGEVYELCKFHYVSSLIHGYKHGIEDCRNAALATSRAAFAPEVADTVAEPELFDSSLPSITLPGSSSDAWAKYLSELKEFVEETAPFEKLVERWDCVQSYQTYQERGGRSQPRGDVSALHLAYLAGEPVMEAKFAMLTKNAARPRPGGGTGYYNPEVCAEILASGGRSWRP